MFGLFVTSGKCLFSCVPIKIAEEKQTHDVTQPIAAFPLKNKKQKTTPCEFPTEDLGLGALQGAAVNLAGKPGGAQSGIPCKKNEKKKKKKRKCNVVSTSATSSQVSAKKSVKQLSVSPYRERKERSSPPASCHIFIAVLGRSDGPHLHAQCGLPAAGEETGETC